MKCVLCCIVDGNIGVEINRVDCVSEVLIGIKLFCPLALAVVLALSRNCGF